MDRDGELTVGLVAHLAFCPRRAWIEAAGEVAHSGQMEIGLARHLRVDAPNNSRASRRVAVDVRSTTLGLVGRCDVIEETPSGLEVSEQKSTPVRRRAEVTFPQHMQVVLQVLCLEDMGYKVAGASVWFVDHQTRIRVDLSNESRAAAVELVALTREVLSSDSAPDPLLDDPRCRRCSHAGVCLPDELHDNPNSRSVSVVNPSAEMIHILSPGARVSLSAGRILVRKGDEVLASVPLERAAGLVIYGNADVSGAAIREMLWRDRQIVWCTGKGRVVGWSRSASAPNGHSRQIQGHKSHLGDLILAKGFIRAKIENSRVLLRRNAEVPLVVQRLTQIRKSLAKAHDITEVMGYEGEAASQYFKHFNAFFQGQGEWIAGTWQGRNRRPSLDPLNCALNFSYGLLLTDCIRALVACGLDPSLGFLHSSTRNKPALALDLMEEFRAPIADSVVIRAANNGELTLRMFSTSLGDSRLTDSGRRCLVAAYEARIQQEIRHPQFGYRATWRRCIEIQARLILGYLDGVRTGYEGMVIR